MVLSRGIVFVAAIFAAAFTACDKTEDDAATTEDTTDTAPVVSSDQPDSDTASTSAATTDSDDGADDDEDADATPPVPGAGGAIASANLTGTSVDLTWTKATDDTAPQTALTYHVYRSASANLATVDDVKSNGTDVGSVTDSDHLSVTGLSAGYTYYFNIVVKDASGNGEVYTTKSVTTPCSAPAVAVHIAYQTVEGSYYYPRYATNRCGAWEYKTLTDGGSGNEGYYLSLALDSQDRPAVSHGDFLGSTLNVLYKNGADWTKATAATGVTSNYTTIAFDSNDKIHVGYYNGKVTAKNMSHATNASGSWMNYDVETTGDVGQYGAIAIGSDNKIHFAYWDATNGAMRYTNGTPGSYAAATVIDAGATHPTQASIGLTSADKAYVTYFQSLSDNTLKYATNVAGSWSVNALSNFAYLTATAPVAIDSADHMHVAYDDDLNGDFSIRTNASGPVTTVDTGLYFPQVGDYKAIALDASNKRHICYTQLSSGKYKVYYLTDASGSWVSTQLDTGSTNVGAYCSLAVGGVAGRSNR